jgi:heme-degrading monooxygenase HmoA
LGLEFDRDRLGIAPSYWRDLESNRKWKQLKDHLEAQEKGKREWYWPYQLCVAKVEREYRSGIFS